MNILFLLRSLDIGGLEVVTSVLANKFSAEGHNISVFAFYESRKNTIRWRLDQEIEIYLSDIEQYKCNAENVKSIRKVLTHNKIEIVINQWGLPFTLLRTARKAAKGLNVKFISVYHNTPDMNGRLQSVGMKLAVCNNPLKRIALQIEKCVFKAVTSYGMRYNYNHSDIYEVLSPSFVDKFKKFTGIKNPTKLLVQTNPVTIDNSGYTYSADGKKKEIIFVGRLDNTQKRVCRVIDTWALLENKCPDWELTIVGDGNDRVDVENQIRQLNLKHVRLEGFQQPKPYYERASILLLTSEFEGFPLVLAECMSFGVIPVVYNSYSAVEDIISDKKDGIVIPYHEEGYDTKEAADMISSIMENCQVRNKMSLNAIEKSKNYSLDVIYKQWEKTFERLYEN